MSNRARKARGYETPNPEPLDRARATTRFTRLYGRNVEIVYLPSRVVVNARTPEELERETDKEFVRRAGDDQN